MHSPGPQKLISRYLRVQFLTNLHINEPLHDELHVLNDLRWQEAVDRRQNKSMVVDV